jgi:(p)ppGpp synthase/HD superfamily hydrolase
MPLTERFDEALRFAVDEFRLERRKGGTVPYVAHLLGVCSIVLEHGGSEDDAIAALLHDLAEDRGGARMLREISYRFGPRVAFVVRECSDSLVDTPRGERKAKWKDRKRAYLERVRREDDSSVLLVAMADKLYNLRALLEDHRELGDAVYDRFNASEDRAKCRKRVLGYHRDLAIAFLDKDPASTLAREVYRTVAELERRGPVPG